MWELIEYIILYCILYDILYTYLADISGLKEDLLSKYGPQRMSVFGIWAVEGLISRLKQTNENLLARYESL